MKDLLNEIMHTEIESINFEKILKLNNMSEYEFNVVKTKTILTNQEEIEVYFKIVKNSRIKESIFCYWCLIYEEELLNKNFEKKEDIFLSKVIISELTKKKFYQSVFLKIENNKFRILENGTEVNFVNVYKFIKENKKIEQYEKILECFENLDDYVLLVGMKMK